ncbi:MAG: right-handed parallel beta-helix repeat-containing protein, partial [Ignavibacteriaceae bacterium]|nr:right-handed parallel beta-helix repeat-containing protein [Ignavibacteriaceae bacterium]
MEKAQGSKFDVVTNRRVSNIQPIQPIQGIQPIQLIHSNHSFHSSHSVSFLLILFFSLFLTASGFSQRIIYVSPNGSSIPPYNSWETAADTINKAISVFQNGDTILIGAGVYRQQVVCSGNGKSYTIIGTDPDSCIIDVSNVKFNSAASSLEVAILFDDDPDPSPNAKSDTMTVKNLTLHTSEDGKYIGILVETYGSEPTKHYLKAENLNLNSFLVQGINLDAGTGEIRNCIIKARLGIASVAQLASDSAILIENNLFYAPTLEGVGIRLTFGSCGVIRNNIMIKKQIYTDYGSRYTIVRNNLITGYRHGSGVLMGGGAAMEYGEIINNVMTNMMLAIGVNGSLKIKNNIILNVNRALGITPEHPGVREIGYNMFSDRTKITNDTTMYKPDSTDIICKDPMFINTLSKDIYGQTPPSGYDYHLEAYSPAIDRGDPMILDKDGSRSDMGMYGGPWGESYEYQDNPPKQVKITRAYRKGEGISELNWRGGTEADFNEFRIYRGTDPGFIPDTTNLIYRGRDTLLTDTVAIPGWYSYKTEGVDNQGNRSKRDSVYFSLTDTETDPPVMTPKG